MSESSIVGETKAAQTRGDNGRVRAYLGRPNGRRPVGCARYLVGAMKSRKT